MNKIRKPLVPDLVSSGLFLELFGFNSQAYLIKSISSRLQFEYRKYLPFLCDLVYGNLSSKIL